MSSLHPVKQNIAASSAHLQLNQYDAVRGSNDYLPLNVSALTEALLSHSKIRITKEDTASLKRFAHTEPLLIRSIWNLPEFMEDLKPPDVTIHWIQLTLEKPFDSKETGIKFDVMATKSTLTFQDETDLVQARLRGFQFLARFRTEILSKIQANFGLKIIVLAA